MYVAHPAFNHFSSIKFNGMVLMCPIFLSFKPKVAIGMMAISTAITAGFLALPLSMQFQFH